MNANELADKLEGYGVVYVQFEYRKRAAAMLRQQQAEIEALKAGKIRAYDNGIEDGRKPNTNPVKELTREDRLKLIGTLKWAEDLLREAGHDEAVDEVQDCIMLLRKAQENG